MTQVSVHRALRGLPGVSPELRRRIREVAHARRYRIKATARAAAVGRSHAISLLLSAESETSGLPPELPRGILDTLEARGYALLLSRATDEQLSDATFIPRLIAEAQCDGILVDYTHRVPPRMIELIEHYRIPAVFINCKRPRDAVYPDDFEAGRRACRALLDLGHREIAYIGPEPENPGAHYSVRDRLEGYAAAMREAGLKPKALCHRWGRGWENDLPVVWKWTPRPTAFVTYSIPFQVFITAAALGLACPRDFSVVTFEMSALSPNIAGLEISRFGIPMREVGRTAAQVLLDKVERGNDSAPSATVPFSDLQGETCAAPFSPTKTISKKDAAAGLRPRRMARRVAGAQTRVKEAEKEVGARR